MKNILIFSVWLFLCSVLSASDKAPVEISKDQLPIGLTSKFELYLSILNGEVAEDFDDLYGTDRGSEILIPNDYPKEQRPTRTGKDKIIIKKLFKLDDKFYIIVLGYIDKKIEVGSPTALWSRVGEKLVLFREGLTMKESILAINTERNSNAAKRND